MHTVRLIAGVRISFAGKSAAQRAYWRIMKAPALILCALISSCTLLSAAVQRFISPPVGSGQFGSSITVLPNGNFVVRDSVFDQTSPAAVADVGAVYLYRHDGTLISTLVGSTASDQVGSGSVFVLKNGNFVVLSPLWNNGATADVGAVTWGHAETGFGPGVAPVSAANSLIGSIFNDQVGNVGITTLPNGNYVVLSTSWDNGAVVDAGAATFCDGSTGRTGAVSTSNSLVGSTTLDFDNAGISPLSNGNYVVRMPFWNNGGTADVGAVTFASGTTGVTGTINSSKSLLGSTSGDQMGRAFLALANGNYVTGSELWDQPSVGPTDVGAVAWCSGLTGRIGFLNAANALIGSITSDQVGGVLQSLANGNYLVLSRLFDRTSPSLVADAGAVTWGSGTSGIVGVVSESNSVVGSSPSDLVGGFNCLTLTNGHYVILAPLWSNPDTGADNAGAAMWCNGSTGEVGVLTPNRALVGTSLNDQIGLNRLALPNGNYLVSSSMWDNTTAGATDAGAVTFGNGSTGIRGIVSASNSLVGTSTNDQVGNEALYSLHDTKGDYLVVSDAWTKPGGVMQGGAITFGNGVTGIKGPVSAANSLLGTTASDFDDAEVLKLTNGNYVILMSDWSSISPTISNVGAAMWMKGGTAPKGTVSSTNALVGSFANDSVSSSGGVALSNGNYVIRSRFCDNIFPLTTDAGAVTWGDGTKGIRGFVSPDNSLMGGTALDQLPSSVLALPNGDYVVRSDGWNNTFSASSQTGAVTWCNGSTGAAGLITPAQSVFGNASPVNGFTVRHDPVHDQLIIGRVGENRVVLYGNFLRSVVRTGSPAPGGTDLAFSAPGVMAVNEEGSVLGDFKLTGAGAAGGKDTAMYALLAGQSTADLVLQKGDSVSALGPVLPANAKVTGFSSSLFQRKGLGLFQATITGTGVTTVSNRLLLKDNGAAVSLLHRIGQPLADLGGAAFSAMPATYQSYDADRILMNYKLKPGGTAGVTTATDTGLLSMTHTGLVNHTLLREGNSSTISATGPAGTFGQFTPMASFSRGDGIHFVASVKNSNVSRQTLMSFSTLTDTYNFHASVGDIAPDINVPPGGTAPKFSSFAAVSGFTATAIYKAFLTGTVSENECVWAKDKQILREGHIIDLISLGRVNKILRFWPVGTQQIVFLVELNGTGVTSSSNMALILRMDLHSANNGTSGFRTLMRTGQRQAGVNPAKISKINAVEVHPVTGAYVILATLSGAPSSSNQALFTGNTLLGNDTTLAPLRDPVLRLRKGDRYSTSATALGTIKGLSIKPATDTTGAGGRGLGQCIGADGTAAVFITGDRGTTELVLVK